MTNILMRIDFQNDFVHKHGALSIKNEDLIAAHQKFADNLFTNNFDKIIETYDTHFVETYPNTIEAKSFPLHCVFGTWGWQSAAPFKPELNVIKMYKSTTNIWNEIHQYQDLNINWHDKNVYLCGLLSDVCIKEAMNGLLKKGANVIILSDLCQGAEQQISDIIAKDVYRPFIEQSKLKTMTTAQFFRTALRNKKIAHNLVKRDLGE